MGRGKGSRDILLGPNQFGRPKEQAVFKNKRDYFPTGVGRVLFTRKMDASPEILEDFVGDYSLIFRNPEGRYDDKLEATSTYFDYPPLAAIDFRTQFLLGKRILENVRFNLEGNKYASNNHMITEYGILPEHYEFVIKEFGEADHRWIICGTSVDYEIDNGRKKMVFFYNEETKMLDAGIELEDKTSGYFKKFGNS